MYEIRLKQPYWFLLFAGLVAVAVASFFSWNKTARPLVLLIIWLLFAVVWVLFVAASGTWEVRETISPNPT